jgi:type III pantothenate kinase
MLKSNPIAITGSEEPPWLIAVDIGNNRVKLARLPWHHRGPLPETLPLLRIASRCPCFTQLAEWLPAERAEWCVASVSRPVETQLAQWVREHRPGDVYRRLTNAMLPIEVRLDNPLQVGTDRLLAAMAAAKFKAPGCPAIVIDAGSAITVDLVSAQGAFEGGAILPGFEMMATALAQQTDQLPLIGNNTADPPAVVGKSTEAAIRSGLFWGHVGAVRELVQRMAGQTDAAPQVFVAGGDAALLAVYLSPAAQVVPHLVFQGLALTHQHLRRIGSRADPP